mgnify:CR=1 FL=1
MPSFTLFDIKAGNATVNTMAKTHRMVLIIFLNYLRNKDFKKYYPSKISYRGYLKKDIYSLKEEYIFLQQYRLKLIEKYNKMYEEV